MKKLQHLLFQKYSKLKKPNCPLIIITNKHLVLILVLQLFKMFDK